jgi:hypothetical protein
MQRQRSHYYSSNDKHFEDDIFAGRHNFTAMGLAVPGRVPPLSTAPPYCCGAVILDAFVEALLCFFARQLSERWTARRWWNFCGGLTLEPRCGNASLHRTVYQNPVLRSAVCVRSIADGNIVALPCSSDIANCTTQQMAAFLGFRGTLLMRDAGERDIRTTQFWRMAGFMLHARAVRCSCGDWNAEDCRSGLVRRLTLAATVVQQCMTAAARVVVVHMISLM